MRLHHSVAAALALALTGCRDFELAPPPSPPLNALGAPCGEGTDCDSKLCADGVCCEKACEAQQTCARPENPGHCEDRQPGDACASDSQCPGGFCSDKVCCTSRCTDQPCHLCSAKGACELAPSNTDERGDCDQCRSCFEGFCAPAWPGSDPNRKCRDDLVCDASGRCGWPAASSCDEASSDPACAQGECLAGRCTRLHEVDLFQAPMSQNAQYRRIMSLAGGSRGEFAVLFSESQVHQGQGGPSLVENSLLLATRPSASAGFVVQRAFEDYIDDSLENLQNPQAGYLPSAMELFAGMAYVATYSYILDAAPPVCGQPGRPPCGLFGQYFALDGASWGIEAIDEGIRDVVWVSLFRAQDGSISAVYLGTPASQTKAEVRVTTRDAHGRWSTPLVAGVAPDAVRSASLSPYIQNWAPEWTPAVANTKAGPVVFYRDLQHRLVVLSAGATETIGNLPPPPGSTTGRACGVAGPMGAVAYDEGGTEVVRFNGYCLDPDTGDAPVTLVGTYRPSKPAGSRFELGTGPGRVWWQSKDDPQYLVPLYAPGKPVLNAQVPPCDPASLDSCLINARLAWYDALGFHQTSSYSVPVDSYVFSFDAAMAGSGTPVVGLTLAPLESFGLSSSGPAVVLLEYL